MRIGAVISSAITTVMATTMASVAPAQAIEGRLATEGGVEYCGFFAEESVKKDYVKFIEVYEREFRAAYKALRSDLKKYDFIWSHVNEVAIPPLKLVRINDSGFKYGNWDSVSIPADVDIAEIELMLTRNNLIVDERLSLAEQLGNLPWYAYANESEFEEILAQRVRSGFDGWVLNGASPFKVAVYEIEEALHDHRAEYDFSYWIEFNLPRFGDLRDDHLLFANEFFSAELKEIYDRMDKEITEPERLSGYWMEKCLADYKVKQQVKQTTSAQSTQQPAIPKQTQKPDAPETKNSQSPIATIFLILASAFGGFFAALLALAPQVFGPGFKL